MNYKKIFINTTLLFLLSSIFHFAYEKIQIPVLAIIFPVNESIFEHIKLIFTTSIFYTIFTDKNNKPVLAFLRGFIINIILLIIYIPIRYLFGENLIITLIILYISIFIGEIIIFNLKDYLSKYNKLFLILIFIIYFIFAYLTYNPLKNNLFYDYKNNIYGIKK